MLMVTIKKHTKKAKYIGFSLILIVILVIECIVYQNYGSALTAETTANAQASAYSGFFFGHFNKVSSTPAPAVVVSTSLASTPRSTVKKTTTKPAPTPTPVPIPTSTPVPVSNAGMQWGAYVGDGQKDLSNFEALVGKPVNILATFASWQDTFPLNYKQTIGAVGKTLVIFWEPDFGYNQIVNGSHDAFITQFAADAKSYGYPIILVPFDEMNLNEEAWGYGINGNTAANFISAWRHIHDLFAQDSNVKFGIAYNNVSIPNVSGNQFGDYYPGDSYVDYVGVDGFNFENPSVSFINTFNSAINTLESYNKPIYIFSLGSAEASDKATWITKGLGTDLKNYANIAGWIWFNKNDGSNQNWLVNSNPAALTAFKSVLP